jgi:hypothetical protein
MKKFLFTISLIAALSNIAFAGGTANVGGQCPGGGSVCPPANNGTLYGQAELGTPNTVYEFECEWWSKPISQYNRRDQENLRQVIATNGALEKKGMSYDPKTDRIKCFKKISRSTEYPFDNYGKVIKCLSVPFNYINVQNVDLTNDCRRNRGIADNNAYPVVDGTTGGSVLRQTNLKYENKVGGYVKLDKQVGIMQGANFVNGDYAATANSVLNYSNTNYDSASTSYKKEAGFGFNSSKQTISLPPQLKPKDIIFARLYWAGNIHSGKFPDKGLIGTVSNSILNQRGKDIIKDKIAGYRTVTMRAGGYDLKNFYAEDKDVYFDYSVDHGKGGLYFMYSNSADVKEYIQNMVEKNQAKFSGATSPVDIEVAVGNIKSNEGEPRQFYDSILNTITLGGYFKSWLNQYGTYIANYGNWSLVIVYDKKDKVEKKIKKEFYKPKYVTLYHGMSELLATSNLKSFMTFNIDGFFTPTDNKYDARVSFFTNQNVGYANEKEGGSMAFQKNKNINDGYETIPVKPGSRETWLYPGIFVTQAGSANGIEKGYKNTGAIGMYTRNVDEYMFGSQTQTSAKFGVSNWNGRGEQSLLTYMIFSTDVYVPRLCYAYHIYSESGEKDHFSAVRGDQIRTIIKFKNEPAPNERSETAIGVIAKFIMDSNNTYNKDSLILNNNVSIGKSFQTHKEAVDKIVNEGATNTEFAFLKDNENGAYEDQDRTKKFTSGIYHDRTLNTVTNGTYTKKEYKREVKYAYEKGPDGKERIKCKKKSDNPQECELNANGDIIPIDYEIKIVPIDVTYNTSEVKLAIGKDIGKDGFVGGSLAVGEEVFLEYTSILGDRYVQNEFALDFAQKINGQLIKYSSKINDLEQCEPEPGDTNGEKIKVIPLNGLRVVNQNVTQNDVDNALDKLSGKVRDSFNSHLYTQIGGKEFKANLVYTPDVSRSVTMNADGTVTIYGEDGKSSKKISYEEFIAQATKDTKFNSYGVVYLSLVPKEALIDKKNNKECKDLTIGMYKSNGAPIIGSDTVPFYYDDFQDNVKIGAGTQNEMNQPVNKDYKKGHPHPSFAVDFNGKNFLALDKLKVDYDMNNYTFVVSYAPYKVNQKEFKDGAEDSKTSDAVKECQKEYDEGYATCSSQSAQFCSNEDNQKDNGGSYSLCLVKKNQSCLAEVSKKYQNCIGGSKEIMKDAVVNKQGLFNVCASDNFAVRPKLIRYTGKNLPRYLAGIKMSENFQRFKAENEDEKPAYGYNVLLNETLSTDVPSVKIVQDNAYATTYQSPMSVIAPVLPAGCNADRVIGASADGTRIKNDLWSNGGMRLGADFRLRDKGSNIIDQANISKLEDEELNKYRNSVRPSGGKYELNSKYDEYGYVYTTPNATDDLDKGKSKDQKTMSLEYYNIGWAGFTLVDNKWTTHDQAGDCIKDGNERFSNKPTIGGKDSGRVGCSVGLVVGKPKKDENEQKWVYAAFDYDRVDVDLLDLKDAFNQTDGTQGNLQNNAGRPVNFTYFYNGNTRAIAGGGYIASGNLDPTNGMGATMQLRSTARLATQASVDGKTQNALYFGVNSTNNGVETKTVNGATVNRGIIPTLFNANCYAQTVAFDMDNRYMPKNAGANANDDPIGLDRNNSVILESSRNWTYGGFAINTMLIQGQANQTGLDASLAKPFQMLNTGFNNGVNNGNFYINFLKNNQVIAAAGGGTGARNPLIIVAEDFNASADLDVCANPRACVIPATNTTPVYDPKNIFNSFANGNDKRMPAVATAGNPSYYYNAVNRTTPLNAANLATNPVGVARFYYGNFNNAQIRPVGNQRLNIATNYFIQPMIYCQERVAGGSACLNANLFPLLGLVAGENVANLVIDAGQRPNFYLNRAFTYGRANIVPNLRNNYLGEVGDVGVAPANTLLATGNEKNYSEQISVNISRGAGIEREVQIFVQPWFLSDYFSPVLNHNRFFVQAAGGAAWSGAGGVKEDKAQRIELKNVGSFLNDTGTTTDGNSEKRTNRITW